MFGYITVNMEELKIKEYKEYRSYYCGLCHSLKDRYGKFGQSVVTYDMAFAALLLTSLYEPKTAKNRNRCLLHPVKPHSTCHNAIIDYMADMNLFMAYHKMLDDWQDEKKFNRLIGAALLRKNYRQIRDRYPQKTSAILHSLSGIRRLERRKSENIDLGAGLFGQVVAEILAYQSDIWEKHLREMGMNLGKFIYLMDAYEDIEEDKKNGAYNPLIVLYQTGDFEARIFDTLTMLMAGCARAFERLPLIDGVEILRNILYSGVWLKYEMIKKKRNKHDRSL